MSVGKAECSTANSNRAETFVDPRTGFCCVLGVLTARRMDREEDMKRMGVLDRSTLDFFAGDIKVPNSREMRSPLRLQPLRAAGARALLKLLSL
jgi:hypothetical protein